MQIFENFLLITTLAAALASALPEPTPAAKPRCPKLRRGCQTSALSYCSSVVATRTTTAHTTVTTTLASFATDCPCCEKVQPRAIEAEQKFEKRGRAKPTIPHCLRNIITVSDDPAATSACSCIGVTQSTTAVSTATATNTAYATLFKMSWPDQGPYGGNYARQALEYDPTYWDVSTLDAADLYQLNGQCNLVNPKGHLAFAFPDSGYGSVEWFPLGTPSDHYGKNPLVCTVYGASAGSPTLECVPDGDSEWFSAPDHYNGGLWAGGDGEDGVENPAFSPYQNLHPFVPEEVEAP